MYLSYGPELIALIGKQAYARLAELCAARAERGLVAEHPATPEAPAALRVGGREPASPPTA
jgi:hypothetical protein